MTNCVFCRIASGEIAAYLAHQDELTVAFLDTHPIRPGHIQVIPREHHACFDDLPAATAGHLVQVGQQLARALKRIHAVPMHEKTDITSRRYVAERHLTFRPMPAAPGEELSSNANLLRSALRLRNR